jgi:hypothetical protein
LLYRFVCFPFEAGHHVLGYGLSLPSSEQAALSLDHGVPVAGNNATADMVFKAHIDQIGAELRKLLFS